MKQDEAAGELNHRQNVDRFELIASPDSSEVLQPSKRSFSFPAPLVAAKMQ
ncbi:hypothetical protein [Deinococcus fonticola]|uniref:hypothetical protein n=1 Tax=Deinococcus fonticola TaxID=2528713 RepID=UPI001431F547